jgi:hypothetical protein
MRIAQALRVPPRRAERRNVRPARGSLMRLLSDLVGVHNLHNADDHQ